jgi:hypothetical protein
MKRFFVGLFVLILLLCTGCIGPSVEDIDVGQYLEHHSIEEVLDYWCENGEMEQVASVLQDISWNEYYLLYYDDMREMVNKAYAYGYYNGAVREEQHIESVKELLQYEEEYYNAITDAILAGDINAIKDYTEGAYFPEDFLPE